MASQGSHHREQQLLARIEQLERALSARPTLEQVQWVKAYADRRERLYEAVLARNIILKRKLDEAT